MAFIIFEFLFFGVLLAGDLLSKYFVMDFLLTQPGFRYTVIDKVLDFRYSLNNGAGFSSFAGKTVFLIVLTAIALLLILGFIMILNANKKYRKSSGRFLLSILVMILAGGMGNLVDRVVNDGYVRDFIDYTIVETLFKRSFAICNLADVWLTVGMILLIIYVIFFYNQKQPQPLEPDDEPIEESDEAVSKALEMYEQTEAQDAKKDK